MSQTWKTVRVFISSTFRDMQAERDWLVRFVFPRLREELLKCRIHFVDVNLRWGVTSDQNAIGVCSEVIDECHPRTRCMLGSAMAGRRRESAIEGRLRGYSTCLSPDQIAELLANPEGRLPLYVLTSLVELRALGTYEDITDHIRTLPGDAREL